jgi:hypothetical protein
MRTPSAVVMPNDAWPYHLNLIPHLRFVLYLREPGLEMRRRD